ncbi:permease prefix domain 1-containing protein [Granulicella sp. L60]|uniref:permease prefix domain 1-containing protein n=1 Tax=Granulicella sp. L60 TaxID=1641866 RepID=UPI00131EB414|nr:permease prefix domain 1-containing protein [Granulicella sp. L60]
MNWFHRIFRRRLYDDLGEELRQHIEEKTEQLMRTENLSRTKAEQAARRAFGNVTLMEQRSRETWQWPATENRSRPTSSSRCARYGDRRASPLLSFCY